MKYRITLIAALASIYSGCGENASGPEYVVVDELFYQKDYDSLIYGITPIESFYPLKLKKIKVIFEYYSNRIDSNYISIAAGYYPHYWQDTIHQPGQYTLEHIFPIIQDTTREGVYRLHVNAVNSYAVIRNLKAYRSY